MKKAMSFLLALIMVVSMLPGVAVPAAAAQRKQSDSKARAH